MLPVFTHFTMNSSNTPAKVSRKFVFSAALVASLAVSFPVQAAEIFKLNVADDVGLATSWSGGVIPTATDVAVWDSSVTDALAANNISAPITLQGIRVAGAGDLTGFVGSAVNLTLGSGGLDMSAATSGNTFVVSGPTVALAPAVSQAWRVADGATFFATALSRGTGSTINYSLGATSTGNVIFSGGTPGLAPWATVGGSDFAALQTINYTLAGSVNFPAATKVVTGYSLGNYVPNPTNGTPSVIPNISGTLAGVLDTTFSNTNAITAFRISNNTSTPGYRFATANTNNQDWIADTASGRNISPVGGAISILVGPLVGARNVVFTGSANWRLTSNQDFYVHQYNPSGVLRIENPLNASSTGNRITKDGPGTFVINTSTNNFSGQFTIVEGTVQIGNNGTVGVAGTGNILNNGILAYNRTNTYSVSNVISGTGQFSHIGSGAITLSGNNTYTGATNLNSGYVEMALTSSLGIGGAINFNGGALRFGTGVAPDLSNRTITFLGGGGKLDTNGNNVTFSGSIGNSGVGGLTKEGTGILTLAAGNSYSGNTTVSAGTLEITNASGSATGSGNITVATGATLTGGGSAAGTASLAAGATLAPGTGGVGTIGLGGLSLASGSIIDIEFSSPSSYDKVVSTNLTVNGGGVHLYNVGGTTQYASDGTYGIFQHTNPLQGSGVGSLTVLNPKAGMSYSFSDDGALVSLAVVQDSLLSDWTATVGGSWGVAGNWSNNIPTTNYAAQFISSLAAPATITLDGDRTVNGAVFDSANGYTIAQGTSGFLTFDKGAQSVAINVISGNHTISAPVILNSTIAVTTNANSSITFTNNSTGAGGLVKSGAGTLDFTGRNLFTGDINAVAGVIGFSSADGIGTGAITLNGATLRYNVGNTADISNRTITVGQDGATLDTNGNDVTLASAFGNNGTGIFTKAGAGNLTLSGNNTFSGGTRVSGGLLLLSSDLQLGASGSALILSGGGIVSSGNITLNSNATPRPVSVGVGGGSVSVAEGSTLTLDGVMSGGGPLTKNGNGTLTLSGSSSANASPITINAGTIRLAGGTTNYNNGLGTGPVTFMGGTLTSNSPLVDVNGTTYTNLVNNIIVPDGQTGTINYSGRSDNNGSLTGNGTLNANIGATRAAFGGNWSAFTGQVNIGGTGDFRLNTTAGFGTAAVNLVGNVNMYVVTNFASSPTTFTIGELSGVAGSSLAGQNATNSGRIAIYSVGGRNTDATFAGTIRNGIVIVNGTAFSQPTAITKVGTGSWTLSGNSIYTGATTVSNGTLIVSGSLGNTTTTVDGGTLVVTGSLGGTPTTVNASGVLSGLGTIGGNLTINGTLRPDPAGVPGGQLSLGGLVTLSPSAVTQIDVAAGAAVAPRIVSSLPDAVTYGGALKFNFKGTVYNGSYTVIQRVGALAGGFNNGVTVSTTTTTDALLTDNTGSTGTWDGVVDGASFSFSPSTGTLTVTGAAAAAQPGVPSGLVATAGNNQVGLSWNASANADAYIVKRATVSGGPYTVLISTQPTPSYVDTSAINGTQYFYVVASKNNNGLVSADSAQVSATPSEAPVLNGLETWRQAKFGAESTNLTIAGDNADPDGDGMVNFLEYATKHEPLTADGPATSVAPAVDGLRLVLTYNSVPDPLLTYTVQGVNDLSGTPVWGTVQTTTGAANIDGANNVTDTQLISASPRRFLRLNVTYTTAP